MTSSFSLEVGQNKNNLALVRKKHHHHQQQQQKKHLGKVSVFISSRLHTQSPRLKNVNASLVLRQEVVTHPILQDVLSRKRFKLFLPPNMPKVFFYYNLLTAKEN